jgi:hypothetical protein
VVVVQVLKYLDVLKVVYLAFLGFHNSYHLVHILGVGRFVFHLVDLLSKVVLEVFLVRVPEGA